MLITGTLVNVATVLAGGILGLLIGNRLPDRIKEMFFQGIGLFTLLLGIMMGMKTANPLVLVLAMITGGLLGEWWRLDRGMERMADRLKTRTGMESAHFTEGLVTAFLLFCMGSMTILGALEEGLGHPPALLITKSLMDGLSAIALTATLGVGVVFSVLPLLLYQGGLTWLAFHLEPFLTDPLIQEMTAAGGLILIGLGLQILQIRQFRILNFLPSLITAILITLLMQQLGLY